VPERHFPPPLQIVNENGGNTLPVRENVNFVPVGAGLKNISVVQLLPAGFSIVFWNFVSWIFGNPSVYVTFFTDTVSLTTTLPETLVLLDMSELQG